jgi:hypothetical protein
LETITDLSAKASVNQKAEQQNRELHNRSENMKDVVCAKDNGPQESRCA